MIAEVPKAGKADAPSSATPAIERELMEARLMGEFQRFEKFVKDLEATARTLKALQQREQFRIVR